MATKPRERQTDELTRLQGLGKASARALKEMDVHTIQDLVAHSVDEIEALLKRAHGRTTRKQIEEWLTQARTLAHTTSAVPKPERASDEGASTSTADRSSGQVEWTPFATFVVEFQVRTASRGVLEKRTICQHTETTEHGESIGGTWPGVDTERLAQWMLDHIRDRVPQKKEKHVATGATRPPESTVATAQPAAELPSSPQSVVNAPEEETGQRPARSTGPPVEITKIQARQPPTGPPRVIATANEVFAGVLKGGEPVLFELSLQLGGPDAAETAKRRTKFNTAVYAHNRATAAHTDFCDTDFTEEGHLSYTAVLPEKTLERGTYRLECLATLDIAPSRQSYLKVPVLRVV